MDVFLSEKLHIAIGMYCGFFFQNIYNIPGGKHLVNLDELSSPSCRYHSMDLGRAV